MDNIVAADILHIEESQVNANDLVTDDSKVYIGRPPRQLGWTTWWSRMVWTLVRCCQATGVNGIRRKNTRGYINRSAYLRRGVDAGAITIFSFTLYFSIFSDFKVLDDICMLEALEGEKLCKLQRYKDAVCDLRELLKLNHKKLSC